MKHLRTKVIGYTMILALLGASMIALLVELRFEREYWHARQNPTNDTML
ncbi:MAG: hypothetical protein ACI9SQ_001010 [Rubritalea sp.]|jgi:hypothetical protein